MGCHCFVVAVVLLPPPLRFPPPSLTPQLTHPVAHPLPRYSQTDKDGDMDVAVSTLAPGFQGAVLCVDLKSHILCLDPLPPPHPASYPWQRMLPPLLWLFLLVVIPPRFGSQRFLNNGAQSFTPLVFKNNYTTDAW
jgi:hypothetical protein